jgi:hypothetical protein
MIVPAHNLNIGRTFRGKCFNTNFLKNVTFIKLVDIMIVGTNENYS